MEAAFSAHSTLICGEAISLCATKFQLVKLHSTLLNASKQKKNS
jgi:hypothetical protein